MSVSVTNIPLPPPLPGTAPTTVVKTTTTIHQVAKPKTDWKDILRGAGIGAGVAGVLGGVALLTKTALPFVGKVASLAGLARPLVFGAAAGAVIPWLADEAKTSPAVKAALKGAGIGAAAGAILPLVPTWLGALVGAGIGFATHHSNNNHHRYPGYATYPGWVPVGMAPGFQPGMPYSPYGMGMPGYGMPPYGSPYGPIAPPMILPHVASGSGTSSSLSDAPSPSSAGSAQDKPAATTPATDTKDTTSSDSTKPANEVPTLTGLDADGNILPA